MSASGILDHLFGDINPANSIDSLMINYIDDDGFVGYTPTPGINCDRISASGGNCTMHWLEGTGLYISFIEQQEVITPFLHSRLGL